VFTFTGFRDGHCHPLFASREGVGPSVDECQTPQQLLDVITAFLEENPGTEWLDCGSFDAEFATRHQLTRELLDTVPTGIPIVVHAADHHSIWVNSAALNVAGFDQLAPSLPHASFDVDANGRPTGIVREWDAMSLIYAHQPAPAMADDLAALERAQERLLSNGIVAVQEAWIDPGMPEVYLEAVAREQLKMRVNLAPRIDQNDWRSSLSFAKSTRSSVRASNSELLTCNTVKVFIDGVFGSETALLERPYCGGGHGSALWNEAELLEMALAADSAGFQLHFHALGDAAVSMALAAVEHLELCNGWVDRRPVIAHAELISQPDFARLRALGVVVCQQPVWAEPADATSLVAAIGQERVDALYPIASLTAAGVSLSFGSDWPVSDPNPLSGLAAATGNRSNASQVISRSQALAAYSTGTAFQLGQETQIFTDEVVLSADPTDPATDLSTIRVLNVKVAGRPVWTASH